MNAFNDKRKDERILEAEREGLHFSGHVFLMVGSRYPLLRKFYI
jgi:hypothetical protein